MSTEKEMEIYGNSVVAYLKCAKHFLQKAEETHGQPLYYDEDGNYIDLEHEIDRQITGVVECYKNDGVIFPE